MKKFNLMTIIVPFLIGSGSALAADITSPVTSANENGRAMDEDTVQSPLYASQRDMDISRIIRRDLIGDRTLSKKAKNIDIVSNDGHVTLIGPVRNKYEINRILAGARRVDGVSTITCELTIGDFSDPMMDVDRGGERNEKR